MAKPMRKLSTGLSSWGILVSGSLLGTAVSEDIADVEEVVTVVELIQILGGKGQGCEILCHHLAENHAPVLKQIYLGIDIVRDRRGIRSEIVIVRPERASNELKLDLSRVCPSSDGP